MLFDVFLGWDMRASTGRRAHHPEPFRGVQAHPWTALTAACAARHGGAAVSGGEAAQAEGGEGEYIYDLGAVAQVTSWRPHRHACA